MAVSENLSSELPHSPAVGASAKRPIGETIKFRLVLLLFGLWIVAAYGGIIYSLLQGSFLGVLGSLLVPALGTALTGALYERLGSKGSGCG